MTAWLLRSPITPIETGAPSDLEARFGGSFRDAQGNAATTATAIYQPNLSAVAGFHHRYWILTGDAVTLMSQAQRDAVDAAMLAARRDAVVAPIDNLEDVLRALVSLLVDEFNAHSAKMNALLTAIDNGASLAAIKTAVAAIADHPTRTLSQLKTAIRNKLGS